MNSAARRGLFLDECGLGPLWVRRGKEQLPEVTQSVSTVEVVMGPTAVMSDVIVFEAIALSVPVVTDELMSAWEESSLAGTARRESTKTARIPAMPPANKVTDTVASDIAGMDWRQLQAAVSSCNRCGLCEGRQQTVFGVGDQRATWLFVGEGPGDAEEQHGEPFVGPAGQLFDRMLAAIGVSRSDHAYITNIVKCRPVDEDGQERSPSAREIAACLPFLQRQIALIQPTVLVALGKTAALSLLGLDSATRVATLRGTIHRYAGLPLVVTYHPAYLLRKPADKAKVWADLCLAMSCHGPAPE